MSTQYNVSFHVSGKRDAPPPTNLGDFIFYLAGYFMYVLQANGYTLGNPKGCSIAVVRETPTSPAKFDLTANVFYPDSTPFPPSSRPEVMLSWFRGFIEASNWIIESAKVEHYY